jgi:hypothetical protein
MSFNYNNGQRVQVTTTKNTSSGISFFGLLTIVFIVLKLCHVIDWGWLWVLSPLWGSTALVVFVWLLMISIVCTTSILKGIVNLFRHRKY